MLICALHCASASLARRRSRDAASGPFLPPASCVSLAQFMCVRRLSSVLAMLDVGAGDLQLSVCSPPARAALTPPAASVNRYRLPGAQLQSPGGGAGVWQHDRYS